LVKEVAVVVAAAAVLAGRGGVAEVLVLAF
jgi:hypothetical protein